jgi:multicomponent Na+:H+ antiporter subunit F
MPEFALVFAAFVLATVAASLVRVARGPTRADRMMAAQLFGTALTSVLLVLSWGLGSPELVDVALVFAALAAITMVAFVRRAWW